MKHYLTSIFTLLFMTLFIFNNQASAIKTEDITILPMDQSPEITKGFDLDKIEEAIKAVFAKTTIFKVTSKKELNHAKELGISQNSMRTQLYVFYGIAQKDNGNYLIMELKNRKNELLNRNSMFIMNTDDATNVAAMLYKLLPVLNIPTTCYSWHGALTSSHTWKMQTAMTNLAYRTMGCEFTTPAEENQPILKYDNNKTLATGGTLIGIGIASAFLAGGFWAWAGISKDNKAPYITAGVFTATTIAGLAAGIPLTVKYRQAVKARKAMEEQELPLSLNISPAFSDNYKGLNLSVRW